MTDQFALPDSVKQEHEWNGTIVLCSCSKQPGFGTDGPFRRPKNAERFSLFQKIRPELTGTELGHLYAHSR